MKTFILLSGVPGSGKSTWAKKYQELHPNTYIVSSDEIRLALWGKVDDFRDEKKVWQTYIDSINAHLKDEGSCTVIGDATNLQNKYRAMYRELTDGFDRHVLVNFKIPYEVCRLQNVMRPVSRVVPDQAMERLYKEYEDPTKEIIDSYDEYIEIHDWISKKAKRSL